MRYFDTNKFEQLGFHEAKRNPAGWREVGKLHREALVKDTEVAVKEFTAEGFIAQQMEKTIMATLQGAPSADVLTADYIRGVVFLFLGFILLAGSYGFLFLTFEPFRLGEFKVHLICIAAAVLTVVLTELFFTSFFEKRWLLFSLSSTGLVAIFAAGIFFALIRAGLFGVMISAPSSAIEISNNPGAASDVGSGAQHFYSRAIALLQIAAPLLAFGLELTCGLALHAGIERVFSPDLLASERLKRIQNRIQEVYGQMEEARVLPEIFEAKYIAGGLKGEKYVENPEKKLAIWAPIVLLAVFIFVLAAAYAFGAETKPPEPDGLVIVLDLTKSTDVRGADGVSEFERNKAGVEALLQRFSKPSLSATVIGITDESFGRPLILLEAKIDGDPGYFGERLEIARRSLASAWRKRAADLKPTFERSDVVGALLLASQIIRSRDSRQGVILILSDMRQCTKAMDLESPARIDVAKELEHARNLMLVPNLAGIPVHVLAVHGANRPFAYWRDLENFWRAYLRLAGSDLRSFTNQREVRP